MSTYRRTLRFFLAPLVAACIIATSQQAPADEPQQTTSPTASQSNGTVAQNGATPEQQSENALQEVVVTARYRAENLQQTPIAITALTSEDMTARGMTTLSDTADVAPNVTMTSPDGVSVYAVIRGIGQIFNEYTYQPGVGFYVDGVYLSTVFGSELSLADVNDVQILRGPQGTLFGKNTEGGAVVITTPDPKGTDTGYVEAGFGDYDRRQFRGAFDASIVPDRLFLRVSFGTENRDGYVNLVDFVCAYPGLSGNLKATTLASAAGGCNVGTLGSIDMQTARATLKWLASDSVTVRASADYLNNNGNGQAMSLIAINPNLPALQWYNTGFLIPNYGIPYDGRFLPPNPYVNYQTYTDIVDGITERPANTLNAWGSHITVDWKPGDNLDFTSISAYRKYNGLDNQAGGESPLPIELNPEYFYNYQLSEEDRLSGSAFADKLEWTIGGYWFYSYGTYAGIIDLPSTAFGPTIFGLGFVYNDHTVNRSEAGYAHALYHLTQKLGFELGLRYSHDWIEYTYYRYPTLPFATDPFIPGGGDLFPGHPFIADISRDFRTDPKAGLQYQWTPQLMTYAQVSTGYKAGGTNPAPLFFSSVVPFSPETVTAYEVGAKTQWLDNRIRFNTDVFFDVYKQLQLEVLTPISGTVVENAGDAHISGWEGELQMEPLPGLVLDASASYLNFKYESLGAAVYNPVTNPGGISLTDTAPFAPKWKGNVGAQYSIRLGPAGMLTPRADFTYQTRIYFDAVNIPQSMQGPYGVLNGHLTWTSPDGKLSGTLEILNALNKFYWLDTFNTYANSGYIAGTPSLPRTFFFDVKRTF